MTIFDALTMIGGLCLFLFGMNIMGQALERRAGSGLRSLLGRMTTKRIAGFFTGVGVTAVIQSSSATTVMVVGFVNAGLMSLTQAINVIMGANVGTTVTGWVLSLSGIDSHNLWVQLLKPSSFTPVLALIGIVLYMFCKSTKRKDTGMILLGFATLMFGMETMTDAVSGRADVPAFQQAFLLFKNPVLGVLAGAVLTAVIQSSSASVGLLQALAMTGQVPYGAAIPIIMGDSIGTCVTAMLSSIGAKKDARRAAVAHLFFNVIGTVVWLTIFCIVRAALSPAFLDSPASLLGIAVVNTAFKVLSTALLLPQSRLLEKLVRFCVPDGQTEEKTVELDERLLDSPSLALEQCHVVATDMATRSVRALKNALRCYDDYTPELDARIRRDEEVTDHYEDILGTYLIKLSARQSSDQDSEEITKLLKAIGDFERISDHGVNILKGALELREKKLTLTSAAKGELAVLGAAINEILDMSLAAFVNNDLQAAKHVEPLEQVIDGIKEQLRTRHILRMQQGDCTIEAGFVWSDLLTNLERTSDHCSNIAGCVIDTAHHNLNLHETLQATKTSSTSFDAMFRDYAKKYALTEV